MFLRQYFTSSYFPAGMFPAGAGVVPPPPPPPVVVWTAIPPDPGIWISIPPPGLPGPEPGGTEPGGTEAGPGPSIGQTFAMCDFTWALADVPWDYRGWPWLPIAVPAASSTAEVGAEAGTFESGTTEAGGSATITTNIWTKI